MCAKTGPGGPGEERSGPLLGPILFALFYSVQSYTHTHTHTHTHTLFPCSHTHPKVVIYMVVCSLVGILVHFSQDLGP